MGIEGFGEITSMLTLTKELHDMGRFDIIEQFYDSLDYDCYFENLLTLISAIFSSYEDNYNDDNEVECMVFMDDIISDYYYLAGEYGRKNKIPDCDNPYIKSAEQEVCKWLNFSYSMDWKLLGYMKSKAAKKSKLIVFTCATEFCEHEHLAYGLLMLYNWFTEKCTELKNMERTDVMAAA